MAKGVSLGNVRGKRHIHGVMSEGKYPRDEEGRTRSIS